MVKIIFDNYKRIHYEAHCFYEATQISLYYDCTQYIRLHASGQRLYGSSIHKKIHKLSVKCMIFQKNKRSMKS